jgi:2-octaprenyl-6-methoxyphenol hydroxylase
VTQAEILIVGAGPVGCTLALALQQAGHRATLLERRALEAERTPGADALRPIALSYASRLILERVGAWASFPVTAIEQVHVSQLGAPGRTLLRAVDAGLPALGYVAEYGALSQALSAKCRAAGIDCLDRAQAGPVEPAGDTVTLRCLRDGDELELTGRCVVHAEGTGEGMRLRSYGQAGIVTRVETQPPARHCAYERFTPEGPLALLPQAGAYAVVWSLRQARAEVLVEAPESEFLDALAATIGRRLGRLRALGPRALHPLALRLRPSRIGPRQAYVGNAAQTLHPVAGQGLNLGLRDAWDLAEHWRHAADPGAADTLAAFAALRRLDARATVGMTDALLRAFGSAHPLMRAGRCMAMTALDLLPPARRFFARRMIFGPSAIP